MNPALVPAVIVGGTALSYLVAILIGVPALVPFLNVAPAFPFMIASLRRGRVAELADVGPDVCLLLFSQSGRDK